MRTEGQAHLLRIFVNESDRYEGRAVYETIVKAARDQGLAGATAMRAIEGYGAGGRIRSVKVLHLSEDVPIIVEIIDTPERIAAFLPTLDQVVAEGVVTVEKVHVLTFRRDNPSAADDQIDDEIQLESSELEQPDEATPIFEPPSLFAAATDQTRAIIHVAGKYARGSRRAFIDSVDVLLAMLGEANGVTANVLRQLGVEPKSVERSLRESVTRDEPSDVFVVALEAKTLDAAKWVDQDSPGPEHLMLALCLLRPSAATDILTRLGAQPRDICNEVLQILGRGEDWQRWLADHPEM
jgi:uncharacterized protein